MNLEIVGAGMAGLLAANMLRHRKPYITEIQSQLPNNHSAVLRFRSHEVADVLNIPFRKVSMVKAALPWENPVADALAYSFKNTGTYRSDRSIIAGLVTDDRFIAPSDLISRMAEDIDIRYGKSFEPPVVNKFVISTLPMPTLMTLLKYPERLSFTYAEGLNVCANIHNCDAFVSLLVPNPNLPMSRISITGSELIIEVPRFNFHNVDEKFISNEICGNLIAEACRLLGFGESQMFGVEWHRQKYAKISPINDDVRKEFMHWATDRFGIFSLGRYATWRPGLLLDDLVKDIRLIDRWIGARAGRYAIARHR